SPRPVPVKASASKHPIPVSHQRTAAPPEPSLSPAQGTITAAKNSADGNKINNHYGQASSRPKSLQPQPGTNNPSLQPSPAGSLPSPPAQPIDTTKPRLDTRVQQQNPSEHEPTKPIAVPSPHNSPPSNSNPRSPYSDIGIESATMPQSGVADMSYLTRPPRLPLPIDDEIHTPGSPIIAPADLGEPVDPVDDLSGLDAEGQALARRSSGLSSASDDIDKEDEIEELRVHRNRPTVPLTLEWRQGGNKVYVTGTIFQWNRKTKMAPIEGQPGCFRVTCNVLPGTHHIRFLVDGQMLTSPDLPTTVDYGNNLVNYIEIAIDETEAGGKDGQQGTSAKPSQPTDGQDKPRRERHVASLDQFSSQVPKYLKDFDEAEDTPLYNNALAAIQKLPSPPSLPGFLSKPILNAATLIKDDSSVLVHPNHTTLNHLATSSIKDNVLAVSATTRYKDKYVTTIIYKPT
ncbi:5'-AMP-activated protein kinase beta subunit, interation domain-containing protein, partial [Coniochaeta sp. 2T2.1]